MFCSASDPIKNAPFGAFFIFTPQFTHHQSFAGYAVVGCFGGASNYDVASLTSLFGMRLALDKKGLRGAAS